MNTHIYVHITHMYVYMARREDHTLREYLINVYNPLQPTATHCNTVQHSATRCNTLPHIHVLM